MHKALFGEGPAHNALCHPGGPCAQRFVSWDGVCVTPCVAQRLVSPRGGRCTTPCVTGCAQRLVSPGGGPVHKALCHSGGGACACGLVVRATDFLPVSHGLKSQGGPVHNALCHWGACAQRLVMCNALCHRGGAGAQRLVSGAACARRLVSQRGALRTTPCVAQRLVSPRGGLCTTLCVTLAGGRNAGLVSRNALCHRVLGGFKPQFGGDLKACKDNASSKWQQGPLPKCGP